MSDVSQPPKKSGWGELGHKWITAIAALVTALAGAGFFIGRTSARRTRSLRQPPQPRRRPSP
ncbi:hypothetical protein ABJI51_08990 [Amycolatopsis sp. NEAU-NG30]|uniref:Uncharacterized protein n=1 Tax=Amycolatopsis melonis TaxID=3156488 RepID=A0ABV0LA78_9PSEU